MGAAAGKTGTSTKPSPGKPLATAAAQAARTTFTLSAVGDTIMGAAPAHLPPNGAVGFFDDVGAALRSDLQMANLEEPLTNVRLDGRPRFQLAMLFREAGEKHELNTVG